MSRLAQYQDQVKDGFGYEDFEPIPNGTEVVCVVEGAAWETLMNTRVRPAKEDEFIKIRLRVAGGDYDNRVVFQKLFILGKVEQDAEKNAKTEENALLMLAAYDAICLSGAMAKLKNDPEDEDLIKLVGKKILVTVGINTFKNQFGETQRSNSVRMLAPVPSRSPRDSGDSDERPRRERRERRPR